MELHRSSQRACMCLEQHTPAPAASTTAAAAAAAAAAALLAAAMELHHSSQRACMCPECTPCSMLWRPIHAPMAPPASVRSPATLLLAEAGEEGMGGGVGGVVVVGAHSPACFGHPYMCPWPHVLPCVRPRHCCWQRQMVRVLVATVVREAAAGGGDNRASQLWHMVRVLVATAVREAAAGGGDNCLLRLAATGERRSTAPPAPAAGLCLVD
ncbi:unnamed protein product, partial [Closterium sp. NIES-64]